MARIVAGQQEQQDPGFAFLQGFQGARRMRMEEQQAQQALQLRQIQLMLTMQEAQAEQAREQAKSQALLNQQAQAGDLAALGRLALESQRSPEQKQIEQAMGMLDKIKDDKLRAEAEAHVTTILNEHEQLKRTQAAQQAIERAATNGDIDPEQYTLRLQSGESPETITQELQQLDMKKTLSGMAEGHSQEAITKAQSLVQGLPEGSRARLAAEFALQRFAGSPYDQQQPGAATKMLKEVQQSVLGLSAQERTDALLRKQLDEGKGWKGRPRDWPGQSGGGATGQNVPSDPQQIASGLVEAWQSSEGDSDAVVDAAKEMGLDLNDPQVRTFIANTLGQVTGADSR